MLDRNLDVPGHLGAIDAPLGLATPDCAAHSRAAAALERELAQLYDEHAPALLRYAHAFKDSRETSRDAVQEAFLRYFASRRDGNIIENARAWLFRVVRNALIDQAKANALEVALSPERSGCTFDPRADLDRGIQLSALTRIMPTLLSGRELECVQLRAAGLQYEEIALVLNLQSGTVGALLTRAIAKLRRALSRESLCL
jgi:RNA polymerase sigma-70 factor (ECF subfamily)